jgi:hypothetical protein
MRYRGVTQMSTQDRTPRVQLALGDRLVACHLRGVDEHVEEGDERVSHAASHGRDCMHDVIGVGRRLSLGACDDLMAPLEDCVQPPAVVVSIV